MSRTLSANYSTENDLLTHKPVVRVTFSGVTRGYTSGTYLSISANDKKFIVVASISLLTFNMLTAPLASAGGISFEILDKDDDVTNVLNGDNLIGVDITIALGWQVIGSGDFLSLPVTTIKSAEFNANNLSYNFISEDARKLIKKRLFRKFPETQLNGALTAAATTVTVDSTTGFIDAPNLPDFMDSVGTKKAYIRIDNEILGYEGDSATTFTTVSRGNLGTSALAHEDDAAVTQVFAWNSQSAAEVILTLLLSTATGDGHAYYDLATYDAGFDEMGVGLTSTEVDIDEIEQISQALTFSFFAPLGLKDENTISLLEEKILKPNGFFMYMKNNGKLTINSFDRLHVEDSFSSVSTLDDDEILEVSVTSKEEDMINTIEILPIKDQVTGLPRLGLQGPVGTYQIDESVAAYGSTEVPLLYEHSMFGAIGSEAEARLIILYRWFYFFSNTPAEVKIEARYSNIDIEPGDFFQITRSSLPNLRDGTKGWTAVKAICTGQRINPFSPKPLTIEAFSWDLYTRIDNELTITDAGTPDDTDLAFSATNDATLETEDAYIDLASVSIDFCISTITLEKPTEAPAGSHETVDITMHVQQPAATDLITNDWTFIRYFTEDSDTITYKLIITFITTHTVDRIKFDWHTRSTATAGKQPTLAFTNFKYGTFPHTISKL